MDEPKLSNHTPAPGGGDACHEGLGSNGDSSNSNGVSQVLSMRCVGGATPDKGWSTWTDARPQSTRHGMKREKGTAERRDR